jgi:hypothetical protein
MSARKLTKKDFEKTLNEKGEKLLINNDYGDLEFFDDYFEAWTRVKDFAAARVKGYGSWLRKNHKKEFEKRCLSWVLTHA